MKKILFALGGIVLLLLSCNQSAPPPMVAASEPAPAALLINLISDPLEDPHSALMGLHLAQKMRANQMEVTVFLNVHGVKLMSPGADSLAFHGENLQEVLTSLISKGAAVRACPHCMEVHGIEASQLLEGVQAMNDKIMKEKISGHPTVFTY